MSRWRAPLPRSTPYITPEGYAALEAEAAALWVRRRATTAALAAAAAEGDRSENAEYIYRKKELRELDRRIRYLQKRMPALKVVQQVDNQEHVFFGAWVTVEDEQGQCHRWRIVGADELDPSQQTISLDSPVARALLKHRVGDEVKVVWQDKVFYYLITEIRYS